MNSRAMVMISLGLLADVSCVAQIAPPQSVEDSTFSEYFTNKANCAVVTGRVNNISSSELSQLQIAYSLDVPMGIGMGQVHKIARFQPDGSFRLDLENPFPNQEIWISMAIISILVFMQTSRLTFNLIFPS